jgi:hypothetical protein
METRLGDVKFSGTSLIDSTREIHEIVTQVHGYAEGRRKGTK